MSNNSPLEIFTSQDPYFIADIAANHDGDLNRAIGLVHLAAEAGANAAKFQHFTASSLVSDPGFRALGSKLSHQAGWGKSVFEVYLEASLPLEWTAPLFEACKEAGIEFMSTPYSFELADHINPFVRAFKIGSGDITYLDLISYVADMGKPWMIATGASSMADVRAAVAATGSNSQGVIMQCNTNYTASAENLRHLNLRVLSTYAIEFPELVLGLSDHTHGDVSVLTAAALGARVFEKHFTDDTGRTGPDHAFSMTAPDWRDMVDRTRDVIATLGDGIKRVEENEKETVVVQRRAIRTRHELLQGHILTNEDLISLRPSPPGSIAPSELSKLVGRELRVGLREGESLNWNHLV